MVASGWQIERAIGQARIADRGSLWRAQVSASSAKRTQRARASKVQAAAAAPVLDRRWSFTDMQNLKKRAPQQEAPLSSEAPAKTELFVMLPMDIIAVGELTEGKEASFIHAPSHNTRLLDRQLATLKKAGAHGVMLDVWWGVCERHGPKQYDFSAYVELFKKARKHDLKVQAVMSFHAGGGNVGDGSCDIPLPEWVLDAGEALGDEIFYTDKRGGRDHECLSLGCDKEAVLDGRTPLQTYADFIEQFAASCMEEDLWGDTVTEICVGSGPCGELRYPAYQEKGEKWSFFGETLGGDGPLSIKRGIPGIGEFQCYDRYMMDDLKQAAEDINEPEWGDPPRDGAGSYDFAPYETEFFALSGGGWQLPYGKFFMEWYSGKLVQHAGDLLDAVMPVMKAAAEKMGKGPKPVDVAIKVAGIHWWYKSKSHAAEMTAGYFNYWGHCGYEPIAKALKKRDVGLSFTCIEMADGENPDLRHCSPEELVKQVIRAAEKYDIQLLAENALEGGLYNAEALGRMKANSEHFQRITLLRLKPQMFQPDEASPEGLRVKQPLEAFLNAFKK